MIGLDTSSIIDIFKGDPNIRHLLENNKEPLAVTIMSYLELFFGLNPENPKHMAEGSYYDEFFKTIYNIELTKSSCKEASKIFWKLKQEGRIIDSFDCVIAALFISNGINKIVTRNSKHFEKIEQLNVLKY